MKNIIGLGIALSLAAGVAIADPVQFLYPAGEGKLDVSSWPIGNYKLSCSLLATASGKISMYALQHTGETIKVGDATLAGEENSIKVEEGSTYSIEVNNLSKDNKELDIKAIKPQLTQQQQQKEEGSASFILTSCERVPVPASPEAASPTDKPVTPAAPPAPAAGQPANSPPTTSPVGY